MKITGSHWPMATPPSSALSCRVWRCQSEVKGIVLICIHNKLRIGAGLFSAKIQSVWMHRNYSVYSMSILFKRQLPYSVKPHLNLLFDCYLWKVNLLIMIQPVLNHLIIVALYWSPCFPWFLRGLGMCLRLLIIMNAAEFIGKTWLLRIASRCNVTSRSWILYCILCHWRFAGRNEGVFIVGYNTWASHTVLLSTECQRNTWQKEVRLSVSTMVIVDTITSCAAYGGSMKLEIELKLLFHWFCLSDAAVSNLT